MTSLYAQREILASYKQETLANLKCLHIGYPLSTGLSKQLFQEEALDKPSQSVFLNLSHYLICIISPKNSLPWPLYNSESERAYKHELANVISLYQSTGLVAPVMSSYFVNPGCFKVIKLIHQLSILAIRCVVQIKLKNDGTKSMLKNITQQYKLGVKESFNEKVQEVMTMFCDKISYHRNYTHTMELISMKMRSTILTNEAEYKKKLDVITKLVDKYLKNNNFSEAIVQEIEKIKDIKKPMPMFQNWLFHIDEEIDLMEKKWNSRTCSHLETSRQCLDVTRLLIARHTGESDRRLHMVRFDPEKDKVSINNLEHVSTMHQHILRNIVRDGKLMFPYLIRGYIVAVCYILKNIEIGDDVYQLREYLTNAQLGFHEALIAARELTGSLSTVASRLKLSPINVTKFQEKQYRDLLFSIPPLPDLTIGKEPRLQVAFDCFTPLNIGRRQFNIQRKHSMSECMKPQQKTLLTSPFRTDFVKSIMSFRANACDLSLAQCPTISFQPPSIINQTVADCSTGFTKHQIMRLLSTKKSTNKKAKSKKTLDINNRARGNLFGSSFDNSGLFRSYSSPNLMESKEHQSSYRTKLSTMLETSPTSFLELSGIATLKNNSKDVTPVNTHIESACDIFNGKALPLLSLTPDVPQSVAKGKQLNFKQNNLVLSAEKVVSSERLGTAKCTTPKTNSIPLKKTSSIEKIINKYKKVRAGAGLQESVVSECVHTMESKENVFNLLNVDKDDSLLSNNKTLPDLISPSYNFLDKQSNDVDWPMFNVGDDVEYKPRESLGTALGIDNTFLDQFELID